MPSLKMVAEMALDSTGFNRGLDDANKKAQNAGKEINKNLGSGFGNLKQQLAGAFTVGAIGVFVKTIMESAGAVNDMATRLGISTDMVQALDFAARQSGATIDDFTSAFKKLSEAREAALEDPQGKEASAFARLGVQINTIKNARLEDVLQQIATGMQNAGDAQANLSDALLLFGKSAQRIMPTLLSDLSAVIEQSKEAGQVASSYSIKSLDFWGDKFAAFLKAGKVAATDFLGWMAGFHNRTATLFDAIGQTITAPFSEDGVMKMKAAWGQVRKEHKDWKDAAFGRSDPMIFKQGDVGGMNGGRAVARAAEWVGPMPLEQIKQERERIDRVPIINSDQFQRIGAFTGASAQQSQRELAYRQLTVLEKLREDLTRTGVIIRGTD